MVSYHNPLEGQIKPSSSSHHQKSKKMSLIPLTSMAITDNCSITQDLSLHSNASEHRNCPNKDCSIEYLDEFYMEHAQNLTDVKYLLKSKDGKDSLEGLIMVDTMQRLGIDNHFHEEIQSFLESQLITMIDTGVHQYKGLFENSLRFRLLRQEGYYVPADRVFGYLMAENRKFKNIVGEDISGLMALYEASQLSIKGENILEEAAKFSSQILNEKMAFVDQHQDRTARYTLRHPYHKSLAKIMARNYIKDFNAPDGWQHALLELANSDFNMVRSIHQKELSQFSRWWKDLGLTRELKLVRDQPLKWYMGPMAALTDLSMSEQRIELTKAISLIYIIDDIFDIYGTVDELTLFTEAVNRWDMAAMEQLPGYMKMCFKALYDVTNEIGKMVYKKHGLNLADSLQKSWASLCDAFLVEAKWFASGHLPKPEEYLRNGIVSSGMHVVLVHIFFLLREGENFEYENSGIISSLATILRLWDDLGSAKDENQDGNDGSYIKCFMNEHQGITIDIARQHVTHMISEAWKCLNKECLLPNPFSATFTKAALNLARMVPLMYSYDDNHRLPVLEDYIKSMFSDHIPLEGSLY
uniref:Linalool/nerolidol synthase n=1 Tax=Chengiopanax sciadophylloides TaxID=48093 RepID=A0A3G9EWY9_CHESC|nr:linalool/nerolidol synthase [Chengiopanax sciadophylloides]